MPVGGEEILADRYRLIDRLGSGGMGVVWRAHDRVLDREVAVKVLSGQYAEDPVARQRVLAEARAAARLSHPHVGGVYDYGESVSDAGDPVPFVVMELLPGRTLAQRLKRGPVSVESALRICAEIASALAAAHAQGLVHRDVKPANVMLTANGARVVDFGLAAAVGQVEEATGQLLGTAAYLAPERLSDDPVVAESDVYALALILYRLLAGRAPWPAETATRMLTAHVYLEPAPLPRLPGVPPVVIDLVHRCLAKKPTRRPASAEVAVTLAHAAGIRVPLELADELADVDDTGPDAGGGPDRGRAAVRTDPLAGLPVRSGEPYVARLGSHLDLTLDHVDLRRQASVLLRGTVGFDLAIWAVLDPVTLMWASCVVDGGADDERFEQELFANEYGQEDVLKIAELAEGPRIGTLHAVSQGDPAASRRFRHVLHPRGFSDELRLTCYDNEGAWGTLLLYRAGGRFTDADVAQLAPAGRPLGSALRQTLLRGEPEPERPVEVPADPPAPRGGRLLRPRFGRAARPTVAEPPPGPTRRPVAGSLTVSRDGRLFDMSDDARALLDTAELDRVGAAVARGRLSGLVGSAAGARHDGRWLAFHAAERDTGVAVTVQRIRPHQVSEFVARARGLSAAQWRLLGAVVRGRNTGQIARELGISAYDVQQGMLALFRAFGVGGRVELVRTLFFDHYVPLHAADASVATTAVA
ncbi:Serine/threonine protein kinase [Micromonospora mirobrigensis]|uniref:non-specific serine/threonine protein kinase n=1 Tax=Micromonospora mirobrigensis TaxID=262898 RepID=A0A1C5ACK5_9ACTN|nr:Serine/threonine protein kinase [Micromonospora mirobrigensis]